MLSGEKRQEATVASKKRQRLSMSILLIQQNNAQNKIGNNKKTR